MALEAGSTLGHYEVVSSLGAGGMGEVYRAMDTKLGREVAIKLLLEEVSTDPERLARFEREARVLASLNHNNIATLYAFEREGDTSFLVMELVEGETLADRIKRGAMPVDEALPVFLQIAEGLEAAHEKGVIHRDLKPANIKVSEDGQVKILDFGLAKAMAVEGSASGDDGLSESPTLTLAATQRGQILGTAAYMAPEQARGQAVDRRADIWAFGVCLFEALTASRGFDAQTAPETLAKILEREPEWEQLPPPTPASIVRLLRRCLTKPARDRLHDIADARIEISDALRNPESQRVVATVPAGGHGAFSVSTLAMVIVVALTTLAAGLWLGTAWRQRSEPRSPPTAAVVVRTEIDFPAEAPLGFGTTALGFDSPQVAVSPDGALIVYIGKYGPGTLLYQRPINSFDEPEPIEGTEGALFAFFSPDGDWLGFLTNQEVKKVSLREGDRPQTVCKARNPTHAAWVADGTIFFAEDEGFTLSSVPEAGGTVTEIDSLGVGGRQTYLSDVLPDGKHALIQTALTSIGHDYANTYLLSLETLERKLLIERGYDARYVPTGHLLFARSGTLYAVAFDIAALEVFGASVPVVPDVRMESLFGQAQVAFSATGTLVYVPGSDAAIGKIASIDRGTEAVEFLDLPERVYGYFEFSPDGSRIALQVADVNDYIVIWDRVAKTERRLTVPGNAGWPKWSQDGDEIAFTAAMPGQGHGLFIAAADRDEEPQLVFMGETRVAPGSWHPDGDRLGVYSFDGRFRFGFLEIGDDTVRWASRSDASEAAPYFSRDGRWFAHSSNRTGRYEIRVRSYPGDEADEQISTNGGMEPYVCRGCDELFYRDGDRWFAHTFRQGRKIEFGPAQLVFETDFIDTPGRSYDVSSDGQQLFVVKRAHEQINAKLHVVVNWFEELKRLVPTE